MSRLAVFGYASLVSPASAAQTLGRPVPPCPLARLPGWRRRWSLVRDNHRAEKTFARADDGSLPPFMLGLNLEPGDEDDRGPNGVLLELSEAELERLDLREIRYRQVDVTEQIETDNDVQFDRIVIYVARAENFASEPPEGAVILANYPRTIESCFAELGTEQRDLFLQTTEPPPVEVIDGILVRDEIPPGNPREW